MRKFRVQFLDHNDKLSEENCLSCVAELSRFFKLVSFESTEKDGSMQISDQYTRNLYVPNSIQPSESILTEESIDLNRISQVIPIFIS